MARAKDHDARLDMVGRLDTSQGMTGADLPSVAPHLWEGQPEAQLPGEAVAQDDVDDEDVVDPETGEVVVDAPAEVIALPEPTEDQLKAVDIEGNADHVKGLVAARGLKVPNTKSEATLIEATARILENWPTEELVAVSGLTDVPQSADGGVDRAALIYAILNAAF